MSNDISIDCETLGKDYDAPVIAIGARAFNKETGKLGPKFYAEVEIASALKIGRVDGSTIAWWIGQSTRAKAIFERPDKDKKSMATVLVEFMHWAISGHNDGPLNVWANGIGQDVVWIERCFARGGYGLTLPWQYDMPRDMRTLVDLATVVTGFDRSKIASVGVEHNAVDDATYQANVISAAWASFFPNGSTKKASVKADVSDL